MSETAFMNQEDRSYRIASYVVNTLVSLAGLFLAYEVLFNLRISFSPEWNIFKSAWGFPCILIGLVLAILRWGKLGHYSSKPIVEYRDSSNHLIERKEDYNVMSQLVGLVMLPIIGHLIIEPVVYGCLIYYPLQCVIALVGLVFPYLIALLLLFVIGCCWFYFPSLAMEKRFRVLGALGLFLMCAFGWGGYAIEHFNLAEWTPSTSSVSYTHDSETPQANASQEQNNSQTGKSTQILSNIGRGLYGRLPKGESIYEGDMAGFPIEFFIEKGDVEGSLKGVYVNVKYGTTINLAGESLPTMDGDINFFGKDRNVEWMFSLTGTPDHISGTASGDGKELKINLHKRKS